MLFAFWDRLRLRALLLGDALRILGPTLLARRHQLLVVLLRNLLLVLALGVLRLEVVHHVVHQSHHAIALPVLLLVCAERLRRGRRGRVRRQTDLGEHRDARARDALALGGSLLRIARVRRASRDCDALLLRQLAALRRLVQVRPVEFVQLVLRDLDELRSRLILGLRLHERGVVRLALLRGLRHRFVQGLDLSLERLDLARERRDRCRHLLDGRRKARQRLFRLLLLVRALLELVVAERLLLVIVTLLLTKHVDHAIDHARDLREIHRLGLQRRRDQAQLRLVRAAHLRKRHHHHLRTKSDRRLRALLQEAHALLGERRHGLLEEVQRVVVVQDFHGLADRVDLLGTHRLTLTPRRLLLRALLAKIREELLRLGDVRLRVLEVVLGLDDLNRNLPGPLRLRLDRRRRSRDLRVLRRGQVAEVLDRRGLSLIRRLQVALHLLLHGLEHARDLARRLHGLLALQEIHHALALEVVQLARRLHHLLKAVLLLRVHLDERTHALLQSGDRALHRLDVVRHVSGRRLVLRLLLRADVPRLLRVLLGSRAGRLVLGELLVQLRLLRLQGLHLRAQLGRTLRALVSARLHAVRVPVAVAHELVEGILLLLALLLDLLLHVLHNVHDPPNGVLLQAVSFSRAPAGEEERQREQHHTASRCAPNINRVR